MSGLIGDIRLKTARKTESFIDKNYYGLMQISTIFVKLDKKHRVYSVLQLLFVNSILAYHAFILVRSALFVLDLNFIIFTQSMHVAFLAILCMIVLLTFLKNRKSFFLMHRFMANDFYDYREPSLEEVRTLTEEILWERKVLILVPGSVLVVTGTILFVAPIIDRRYGTFDFDRMANITSNTMPYTFSVYPYQTRNGFSYYCNYALQLTFGIILSISIAPTGYAYIVISQSLILQLKILLVSLANVEKRSIDLCVQLFSVRHKGSDYTVYKKSEFAYCYSICLRKNFEHHQIILRYQY